MILVWNNMNSFKRHLDDMKTFRQTHKSRQIEQLKDMPELFNVKPPQETGIIKSVTDKNGKAIFVSIWKIALARGINN
jgi:hypothetical protein